MIELSLDMQTIIPWVILTAGLIYETTMFIYRKIVSGEQFSLEKYALTYGYVGLLAVLAYITTGVIPGIDQVMVKLTEVPDYTAVLPIITAVIFGIFQQGSKAIQTRNAPPEPVTPTVTTVTAPQVAVPTPPTGTSYTMTTQALGYVLGIYGGSARSNPPQQSFTCDVNQIPMMFFDLMIEKSGKLMYQVFCDSINMTEMMGTNVKDVGKIIPYDFYLNHNVRTPGTHKVVILIGQQDMQTALITWDRRYDYTVTFTGTLPLE